MGRRALILASWRVMDLEGSAWRVKAIRFRSPPIGPGDGDQPDRRSGGVVRCWSFVGKGSNMPNLTRGLALVLFLSALLLPPSAEALAEAAVVEKTVTISGARNSPVHRLATEILKVAYARIGYQLTVEFLPTRRSLIAANAGSYDGEVGRISGVDREFSNLIPVPTPISSIEVVAFARKPSKFIRTWEDLKGLRVGIVRGELYAERRKDQFHATLVDNYVQLFEVLLNDRVDVVVGIKLDAQITIARQFADQGIRQSGALLYASPLFHLLRRENSALLSKLDGALTRMRDSGEYQVLQKAAALRLVSLD